MNASPNINVRWVDLSEYDCDIVVASFQDPHDHKAVLIRGPGSQERDEALAAAGFRRVTDPVAGWMRPGSTFRKSELLPAFPRLTIRETAFERTRVSYQGRYPLHPPETVRVQQQSTVSGPPTPPAPADTSETRKANRFQVPYRPASRLGAPIAMIPVNMAEATANALAKVEAEHGPMDDFVGRLLGMSAEKLKQALSPEQIDAVGMGIAANMRGRGFILADQTGLGKGRVLAGYALAARRMGKTVVFLTEKPNLFSDFWRDLSDIGATDEIGTPFLLNEKARIIDVTSDGRVLFESAKSDAIKRIVKSGKLPKESQFLMATYSQFNRIGSVKGKFLEKVAEDAFVIIDEAHNGIGDSNTRKCLDAALANAWGTIRSSATFARRSQNLLSYGAVLPPSLRKEDQEAFLHAGGNTLAEAISQYLAEDGVLLRREHDLSGIKIDVVLDEKRMDRNRAYADALAPILARMAKLARTVADDAETRNEESQNGAGGSKQGREYWYSANFGSNLSPLIRQFVTALSVDLCVERCIEALLAGEKPVVVIESTMESLMRELSSDTSEGDGPSDAADASEDGEAMPEIAAGTRPPDFRAALELMLDRIMTISCKRKGQDEPDRIPVDDPFSVAEANAIRAMIARFPDLSLSPIDDIRGQIEAVGIRLHREGAIERPWRADEISARKLRVRDGVYESMPPVDRNDTIVAFNSGGIDALVITRAASTGLSLHASERVADQRRRRQIELQIPANVVERIQFWGRVNRRGQVSVPAFETLSTGLPLQMRLMAMENRKVEALSANVSASASNASSMDVPDVLDAVGNDVARRILEDRPALAEAMSIAMRVDPEQAEQELYFINKILQRLCLLPSKQQDEVFNQIVTDYADALAALKAKGQTPRGEREFDGIWREVSRDPYEPGSPTDGPVFGRPVDLVLMEAEVEKQALDSTAIRNLIASSRRRLGEASGNAAGPFFEKEAKAIKAARRKVLTAALSGRLISVDSALAMNGSNAVKAADERINSLLEILASIQPGLMLSAPGDEGDPVRGVIVDVRAPTENELHLPGRWGVRYALPGDPHPREISIATIMRERAYVLYPSRPGEVPSPSLKAFDEAPRGVVVERRKFLDGNLVKAVAIAAEVSAGSLVSFKGQDGRRRRAVLVSRRGHGALFQRSKPTRNVQEALAVLQSGNPLWTNPASRADGIMISQDVGGFIADIPKGAKGAKFETQRISAVAGRFRHMNDCRRARIDRNRIEAFLTAVLEEGYELHFPPPPKPLPEASARGRMQFRGPRRP